MYVRTVRPRRPLWAKWAGLCAGSARTTHYRRRPTEDDPRPSGSRRQTESAKQECTTVISAHPGFFNHSIKVRDFSLKEYSAKDFETILFGQLDKGHILTLVMYSRPRNRKHCSPSYRGTPDNQTCSRLHPERWSG